MSDEQKPMYQKTPMEQLEDRVASLEAQVARLAPHVERTMPLGPMPRMTVPLDLTRLKEIIGQAFPEARAPIIPKPCPFCGAEVKQTEYAEDTIFAVIHGPGCFMANGDEPVTTYFVPGLLEMWNRRQSNSA